MPLRHRAEKLWSLRQATRTKPGSPPLYDTVGRPRSSMVESQNMSRLFYERLVHIADLRMNGECLDFVGQRRVSKRSLECALLAP